MTNTTTNNAENWQIKARLKLLSLQTAANTAADASRALLDEQNTLNARQRELSERQRSLESSRGNGWQNKPDQLSAINTELDEISVEMQFNESALDDAKARYVEAQAAHHVRQTLAYDARQALIKCGIPGVN